MLYTFCRNVLWVLYRIIFRIEILGKENVPNFGGVILACNHRSNNDAIFLAICQDRKINFIAKDSLEKIPVISYLLKKIGTVFIKRNSGDIGALRKAVEVLKDEKVICIFPEGTRNKTKEDLLEFKSGVSFISYKAGVPIVPCAISGNLRPFSKIRVSFGTPVLINGDKKPDLDAETMKLKEEILKLYK